MDLSAYQHMLNILKPTGTQLLAVSKTKSAEEIMTLYNLGQRDFGENYVQELLEKQVKLPSDIRWHFIGHLQSNKVKLIVPFIYMIQSVDSLKLLLEIDKHAEKNHRKLPCLLQIHIAQEETKFGLDKKEVESLISTIRQNLQYGKFLHTKISGCMGMASLTDDASQIRKEFQYLKEIFQTLKNAFPQEPVSTLSMGMSNDYSFAIELGSTMIRIGSLIFGERNNTK
jgi:PLP dependent protein